MVEETTKKSTKATTDIWEKKVKIKVPKIPGEDNFIIASLNGRAFKIQRGKEVEVPLAIAEIIQESMEKQEYADDFIESIMH